MIGNDEIFGVLTADEIIDHNSIFPKTVYSVDGKYLDFSKFVGKTVRIEIVGFDD
jgi:hypothetical protein